MFQNKLDNKSQSMNESEHSFKKEHVSKQNSGKFLNKMCIRTHERRECIRAYSSTRISEYSSFLLLILKLHSTKLAPNSKNMLLSRIAYSSCICFLCQSCKDFRRHRTCK